MKISLNTESNSDIKNVHNILIKTGMFFTHPSQKHLYQVESHPHHLQCIDGKTVLYLDNKLPYTYLVRGVKISIMDWTKNSRPTISLNQFFELTTEDVRLAILFNLDLFQKYL